MKIVLDLPRPEDKAFLEAIRARPDDDTPRLVYADHLLERGDRRGELIIAQCQKHPRAVEIERAFDHAWRVKFGPDAWRGVNVRGLIEIATNIRPDGELAMRLPFLSAYPVRVIGLVDPVVQDLDWLLRFKLRLLQRIRIEMGADYVEVDARECATICGDFLSHDEYEERAWSNPRFDLAVRAVCLHRPRLGDDALGAIRCPHVERVEVHDASDEMLDRIRTLIGDRRIVLVTR